MRATCVPAVAAVAVLASCCLSARAGGLPCRDAQCAPACVQGPAQKIVVEMSPPEVVVRPAAPAPVVYQNQRPCAPGRLFHHRPVPGPVYVQQPQVVATQVALPPVQMVAAPAMAYQPVAVQAAPALASYPVFQQAAVPVAAAPPAVSYVPVPVPMQQQAACAGSAQEVELRNAVAVLQRLKDVMVAQEAARAAAAGRQPGAAAAAGDSGLEQKVEELRGRVSRLEGRTDQHEKAINAILDIMKGK